MTVATRCAPCPQGQHRSPGPTCLALPQPPLGAGNRSLRIVAPKPAGKRAKSRSGTRDGGSRQRRAPRTSHRNRVPLREHEAVSFSRSHLEFEMQMVFGAPGGMLGKRVQILPAQQNLGIFGASCCCQRFESQRGSCWSRRDGAWSCWGIWGCRAPTRAASLQGTAVAKICTVGAARRQLGKELWGAWRFGGCGGLGCTEVWGAWRCWVCMENVRCAGLWGLHEDVRCMENVGCTKL